MNWTKLSAIAETLSSIAILLTLVYLAIEVRQNTATLESTSRQAGLNSSIQTLYVAMHNPEIWLSRVKPNLTEAESVRLSAYLIAVTLRGQIAWQQYQARALDETGWLTARDAVIVNLKYTQSRKWWAFFSKDFDPGFQEQISSVLAETPNLKQLDDVQAFQ